MRPHTQPCPAPSTSGRAPTAACACSTPGRRGVAVAALPATLVTTVQDAIVGGAVFAAIGAAAWAGTKGDPEPCSLCAGTGGCGCFACGSSGATAVPKPAADALPAARRPKRDILGRVPPPAGQCRVCGGTGLVLCSSCRGSGYRKLL